MSEITFTLPVGAELHLRLDQPEHADETFALIEKDRGSLGRWMAWVAQTRTRDDLAAVHKNAGRISRPGRVSRCRS